MQACRAVLALGALAAVALPASGGAGSMVRIHARPVAAPSLCCADMVALRGGSEDSGDRREAAYLAEMGLEPVKEGEDFDKFDVEGRRFTPAAPTIPGELCSDDDLSNLSEQGYYYSCSDEGKHCGDPEYLPAEHNVSGVPPLSATVRVKYYDLASGATYNISAAFPDQVPVSGMWQLAIRVHAREYTFCAHRGVITYDPRLSPYGRAMCVRRVGSTTLRDDEVVHSLRTLHHRFNSMTFDAWKRTSIDFCEQLAFILTGNATGIPRSITVPILLEASSDDSLATWGDLARHNRSVSVSHLPAGLDRVLGETLGNIFRKWGQRPPNRMRLGPNGEHIGPFLPTAQSDYWEPAEGHLAVGAPITETLLRTRDEFEKAHRARMLGYLKEFDRALDCTVGEGGGDSKSPPATLKGLKGGGGVVVGSVLCHDASAKKAKKACRGARSVLWLRGGAPQRSLQTQVAVVKRLLRDFEVCGQEARAQRAKVRGCEAGSPGVEGAEGDLKQQQRVLEEADASVVDARARLEAAITELISDVEIMQASAEEQVQGEEAAPRSAEVISEDIVTDLKSVADAIFMLSSPSLQATIDDAEERLKMAFDDMSALLDSCKIL